MKKVLWLNADRNACGVYRCYVPSLSLSGYDHHFLEHSDSLTILGPKEALIDDIDLVIMQRAVDPRFVQWADACKARKIPYLYETDDDVFHISKHNPVYREWGTKEAQTVSRRLMERAAGVIVSTAPLKDSVLESTDVPAGRIHVGLNHLHQNVWGPDALVVPTSDNGRRTVIGWQGSSTHNVDFTVVIPALERICADFPNVWFRFFGYVPLALKGKIPPSRFEFLKGVPFLQYPRNLKFANYDIGIAPLIESKFNRAKSNIKWLEYSTLRVPCVASPVHPYGTSIEHGKTGFLASTTNEWYDALAALILDFDLRARIGNAAHDHVWQAWSTTRAKTWQDLFTKFLGAPCGHDSVRVLPESSELPIDAVA